MNNTVLSLAMLFGASLGAVSSAQSQPIIIPAGTPIRVRTIDPIGVRTARPGSRFKASLADPITAKTGAVLIPRGAPVMLSAVNVKRAGRLKGRDQISLKVDSITFAGRTNPVVSTVAESRGGKRGIRTLTGTGIGAGAGALVGGLAGGPAGFGIGTLVGGGAGTGVAAATGKRNLTIPPESVLAFQLQSPLQVK